MGYLQEQTQQGSPKEGRVINIGRIRELTEKLDEIAKKYPDMITEQDKELEKQWLEELERIESNGRDTVKAVQARRRTSPKT